MNSELEVELNDLKKITKGLKAPPKYEMVKSNKNLTHRTIIANPKKAENLQLHQKSVSLYTTTQRRAKSRNIIKSDLKTVIDPKKKNEDLLTVNNEVIEKQEQLRKAASKPRDINSSLFFTDLDT